LCEPATTFRQPLASLLSVSAIQAVTMSPAPSGVPEYGPSWCQATKPGSRGFFMKKDVDQQ